MDLEVEEEIKSIRRLSFVIRRMPWLFKLMISFQSRGLKDLEKAERKMRETIKKFPEPDREVMDDPKLLPLFIKESAEAFRQGNKGAIYEGKLYAKPWGFSLEDISPKLKVYLWHGEVDEAVPVAMGRGVCKAIPNCEGKFYPNDGHYSTIFKYFLATRMSYPCSPIMIESALWSNEMFSDPLCRGRPPNLERIFFTNTLVPTTQ